MFVAILVIHLATVFVSTRPASDKLPLWHIASFLRLECMVLNLFARHTLM